MKAATPVRLQRSRKKGSKLVSPNGLPVVCVTRPHEWGNPFRVGCWYIMGDPDPAYRGSFGMLYCEVLDSTVCVEGQWREPTLIETPEQAVDWFRRLELKRKRDLSPLRGKNLACFCKPGDPCHADVLLELAAAPAGSEART